LYFFLFVYYIAFVVFVFTIECIFIIIPWLLLFFFESSDLTFRFSWCEKAAKPRILGFIEKWLTLYFADFTPVMLDDLKKFLDGDNNNDLDQELATVAGLVQLIEGGGGEKDKKSLPAKSKSAGALDASSLVSVGEGEKEKLTRENAAVSKAVKNLRGA
jgi:hypothetical protein